MENSPTLTKVLYSAGSVLLTIVTIAVTVSFFLAGMKQDVALMQKDIELIEDNHLIHIQKALEDQILWNKDMEENIDIININIVEILTTLKFNNKEVLK